MQEPWLQVWLASGSKCWHERLASPHAVSCSLGLVLGSPWDVPGRPLLSPLGGVMASLTSAALASHLLISFSESEPEFPPVAPTEVPRGTLITRVPQDMCPSWNQSLWSGDGCAGIGEVSATCGIFGAGVGRREWLLGR